MAARVLDGPSVAAAIRTSVAPDVQSFTAAAGRPPALGIVLVGDDPGSEIYVRNKVKAGGDSGLRVDLRRLSVVVHAVEVLQPRRQRGRGPGELLFEGQPDGHWI